MGAAPPQRQQHTRNYHHANTQANQNSNIIPASNIYVQQQNRGAQLSQISQIPIARAQTQIKQPRSAPSQVIPNNQIRVIQNDINIKINSIKGKQVGNNFSVSFIYDILVPATIQIFINAIEKIEPFTMITKAIEKSDICEEIKIAQPGKDVPFTKQFRIVAKPMDSSLILRISREINNLEQKVIFYNFKYENDELKLIHQKMELNQQAFFVEDIFGIDNSELTTKRAAIMDDTEKMCIICMEKNIDTVIIPCKHMCICFDCAKELHSKQATSKTQFSKACPVCRITVESFIRIKRGQQQQQN